jgi:predicted exporter
MRPRIPGRREIADSGLVTTRARQFAWFAAWLGLLAALVATVLQTLDVGTDLRLFLPRAESQRQALVLEGIGEGPAARLLILAIEGDNPVTLAGVSKALAANLREAREFQLAANGAAGVPDWLMRNRYLLTESFDERPLDTATLRAALEERIQDLASPAAPVLEPLLPADPTLEVAAIGADRSAQQEPRTIGGVWFDAGGRRALLLAQTQAAGFDPDGQERALATLEAAFRDAAAGTDARLVISGPGYFSALMKKRTQQETAWLGSLATAGLIALLIAAYRRWRVPLLAPLPLATGALAGLAAVGAAYGQVHGITLAFGFTLIGVAQDYPIHLFSHQRAGIAPDANARELWPTLATGVAATCIAYAAFLASGVTGLAQLGLFSITGLAVAALATRFMLPRMSGEDYRDPALSQALVRAERMLSLPRLAGPVYTAAMLLCVAVIALAPGPAWQDDLGMLTPVPPELLAEDARLRAEIGAPNPRYMALVSASDAESALRRLESLDPGLKSLAAAGVITGYAHAARYLPSVERQRFRQSRLPAPGALASSLAGAVAGLPFRAGVFAPFLADVERARTRTPLTPAGIRGSEQGALLESLLHVRGAGARAVISFTGVADPARLHEWAAGQNLLLIDLKNEVTGLAASQRERVLACLAAAAVLLVLVVWIALRDPRRVARVVAPVSLTTAVIVAALRGFGVPLDLFHLMSLVLAAGLGVDYALFFERTKTDREERLRTLHAVLVSSLSTLMVFAILSFSSIPVLRSIGVTVTLGVFLNFFLALAQPRARAA